MKTLLFLGLFISNSLFAASIGEFQNEINKQTCLTKLKLELREYKNIPTYYIFTDSDKRPLETIFTDIQKLQDDYFKALSDWRESYNKEAKDLSELSRLISSLDQTNSLTEKLQSLMKEEETLLRLVHTHNNINKERLLILDKALVDCSSNNELIGGLKENLKNFSLRLIQIQNVVAKSQSKRTSLFTAAKKAIKLELETKYAGLVKIDLAELGKRLTSVKLGMDLTSEMDSYYRIMTQKNMSYTKLLYTYLQYEAPLALIREGFAKGEEFRKRIDELTLTADERDVMIKNLELYLAPLTRAFTETLAGGPEKKLARQKVFVAAYKKIAAQLLPTCLPAIAAFENAPSEATYAPVPDNCKKAVVK